MTDRTARHHQNESTPGKAIDSTTNQIDDLIASRPPAEAAAARRWLTEHSLEALVSIDGDDVEMDLAGAPPLVAELMRAWVERLDRAACPSWCIGHEEDQEAHTSLVRGCDDALVWLEWPTSGVADDDRPVRFEFKHGDHRAELGLSVEDAQELGVAIVLTVGLAP